MNVDIALLALRLVVGLTLAAHGAQKAFGWFGGPGPSGMTAWLNGAGFRPAKFWAFAAGAGEFLGGLFLAIGLLTPLAGIAAASTMIIAGAMHWPRFWATKGGIEYPLTLGVAALAMVVSGAGSLSLDGVLGIVVPTALSIVVVVLAAISIGTAFTTRRPAPAHQGAGD